LGSDAPLNNYFTLLASKLNRKNMLRLVSQRKLDA